MQVARDERAVPGDVDVLDPVGCQGNHLVIAAAHASVQIALLVVVLEDNVLGASSQDGGLEVEVERCLGMAGGRLSLCQCFDAACLQSYVLADHIVVAHAARQAPPTIALEMEDLASLLDEIVQHPLLTIARQPRSAAYGVLWTCHGGDPPSSNILVSK